MLVSADELISYMSQINLTAPQKAEAESTLSGVQAELETYLARPLELVQIREAVRTDAQGYANVSVSPVLKVVGVTSVGVGIPYEPLNMFTPYIPAPMERDTLIGEGGLMIDYLTNGVAYGDPLTVPGGIYVGGFFPGHCVVEYIGGIDLKNRPEYKGVCQDIKRVAAREVDRMHDDTLSLRGDQAQEAAQQDNREKGWQDSELVKWDRLRRRIVA